MSLKWRARLTCAGCLAATAAVAFGVGPDRLDESPWYVAAAVFVPIVALLAAQLFAFRCPHCGARAVTGRHGYFLVSDACAKCLRDFEGPNLSDDELGEKLIGEDNPELAREMRRERLEIEDLRQRASVNPHAAVALERILKNRLEGVEGWAREMRQLYALKQVDREDVAHAEASLKELQDQLAWCASLTRGSAEDRSRLTSA